ncbi:uncharacterized protein LOC128883195 isoform X2 [Hylaeus volcanicus]|uniref:uncharacterized protein LOC128883195 isoform X2 n=1 Tax=Hylaeus volcanicus TaxID=313075 RepID=UPI0023B808A7|nr:uncharacterized protein LOC128883195 isoform X2 [Hylaeus volcanicus]
MQFSLFAVQHVSRYCLRYTAALFVTNKNDITQYYFSSVSEPLDITDKEFSMFVMYLKHRLKKKLLTDVALQQQVVGTCAKTICGIFHHHVYDPIENQCRSFKHNLESELKSKPYFELTRAGRKTLAKQPV